jgi:hypothetical protein
MLSNFELHLKRLKIQIILLIGSLFLVAIHTTEGLTNPPDPESLQQDSDQQLSIVQPTDPNLKWDAYLSDHNLIEGVNTKSDGTMYFIAKGESYVGKSLDSKSFIDSRTVAYNKALLNAKNSLAESVASELKSERSMQIFETGGEVPPVFEQTVNELSIADKARTLTSLALDDEIKKFDPTWDGTNKSKEEKIQKVSNQIEKYKENLSQKARLFIQGASPIFNAEGPVSGGKYSVVVGMVWSANFTKIAESMYNPSVQIPLGKKALPVKEQIDQMLKNSPDSLAASMGVRVWRNERGERALVSYAAALDQGSPIIAKNKTTMRARSQIAQFIGEQIASKGFMGGGEETHFYDDSSEAFDNKRFEQEITARSKLVKLSGSSTIYYWRGKHPTSNQKMVVNVVHWSPSSANIARDFEATAVEQEDKMDSIKGGTLKKSESGNVSEPDVGGAAVHGLSGDMTDPDDF